MIIRDRPFAGRGVALVMRKGADDATVAGG